MDFNLILLLIDFLLVWVKKTIQNDLIAPTSQFAKIYTPIFFAIYLIIQFSSINLLIDKYKRKEKDPTFYQILCSIFTDLFVQPFEKLVVNFCWLAFFLSGVIYYYVPSGFWANAFFLIGTYFISCASYGTLFLTRLPELKLIWWKILLWPFSYFFSLHWFFIDSVRAVRGYNVYDETDNKQPF